MACRDATAGSPRDGQLPNVTIKGSITYDKDGAPPSDSRAVIELRHVPALPGAPPIAAQQIDLGGKAASVSFQVAVERYRLVGVVTYIVRVAIVSGTQATWISDDIKIDVTASDVDAGTITLRPVKAGVDPGR